VNRFGSCHSLDSAPACVVITGAGGFGSCLCFGLWEGGGGMASAKSEGENLSRLLCGGLMKLTVLPVEKLYRWACQSLLFIVVENLSGYTKGIGGNVCAYCRGGF